MKEEGCRKVVEKIWETQEAVGEGVCSKLVK